MLKIMFKNVSKGNNGSQMFTNVGFKTEVAMPIVIISDITSNPLVILGVWSPIPDNYFAPEYCSTKFTSTLPHPNPFPGFFFASLKRPEGLNFGT